MKFHVLGPLELTDNGESIPIQGIKQRAVLGFLLLNANRVVSTSALMDALWPIDEVPNSARKILHNAIWGLRGALNSGQADQDRPSLLTRPPGYVLQLDPEDVDVFEFQRLAKEGQAQLSGGSALSAAQTLQQAVGLWRGAVLADLVEAGFTWPELVGLESTRVDVLEDYFEAELALGRHHAVLREIETAMEAGTLRERLCGQLMLALYRCGRHTDALSAYNRMRKQLVEQLGLEPGRGLQWLQQAILRHDDSLLAPGRIREHAEEHTRSVPTSPPPAMPEHPVPAEPSSVAPDPELALTALKTSVQAGVAQTSCSVVMVQVAVDGHAPHNDRSVERGLTAVADALRHTTDYFGGTAAAPAGPALLAVFTGDEAPKRAVSTALAMLEPRTHGMVPVNVRATVVTGEAQLHNLVEAADRYAPPMVTGPVLDTCRTLMAYTAAGTARACERTRTHTAGTAGVSYTDSGGPAAGWRARSVQWRSLAHPSIPVVDRDHELDVLCGLLGRTRHRSVSQLVTVLGEGGVGKTRLVLEFERRAMARWDDAQFLVSGPEGARRPLGLLRNLLVALCDAAPAADAAACADLVRQVAYACIVDQAEATEVGACVAELITAGDGGPKPHRREALLAAGVRLLHAVALDHPLVVFVDDGHELDATSLDFLEQFVGAAGPSPLMVILAARPNLLRSRPTWGCGQAQGSTLTLPHLTDATVDRLSDILLSRVRQGQLALPTPWIHEALGDEAPHGRRRHLLRTLMRLDTSPLPQLNLGAVRVERVPVRSRD
ncbi:BTAD domain-containing putative transcriptional regulator [Streptomyces sp. DG2A-72]|uniref:BTAD domain-containing putative transcriptional regulator n=1 Tax=Streptomyces sp. DG2A-72 TaxID=3051386 RepID=UPI00265BBDA3|nr:BTAD domain-containing putative transcriptional regulator [Streptomyces sp. DG2A-72]MDO0939358.1 BTAD domain-containing putative transcriptional regulator [Streptomyces sp. DG2A-72]